MSLQVYRKVISCTLLAVTFVSWCPVQCSTVPSFNLWLVPEEDRQIGGSTVQVRCHDDNGKVFLHQCGKHIALFCKGGYAYFRTTSYDEVLRPFLFSQDLLKDNSLEVTADAFAFCGRLMFFILQGDLFFIDYPSGNFTKVPLEGDVTDVETSCNCLHQHENPDEEFVIAWNRLVSATTLSFHLSQDGGKTFKRKTIKGAQGYIQNGHFLRSHRCIGFLVRTSTQTAKFFYYSYIPNGGHCGLKGLEQLYTGNLSSNSVGMGDSEIMLWDDESLRYSANGGQSFLPVYEILSSGGSVSYNYSKESRPFQILSEASDTFIVRNVKEEVFFGKAGITPSVFKISGLSIPQYSAVSLSDEVNIMVWSLQFSSASPSPGQPLVLSSDVLYPLEEYSESCKHQSLTISQPLPVYYLDIGMTMVLDVSYIPDPWMEDKFIVSVENPDIISTLTDVTPGDTLDKGVTETKLAVNVSLVASGLPAGLKESARGASNVKVSILDPNPHCLAPTSKTTRIVAGCPSYKEIRVRRTIEVTECENMKHHQYAIPRDKYDPHHLQGSGPSPDWEDLEVTYDYWRLGCPHPVYYGFLYKPVIELYEHDVFREVVVADFVLIEAHGMHSYTYTETAGTAGCKRGPQSWISMLAGRATADPHSAWTRQNYLSCHSAGPSDDNFDSSQPYQVLSNNTANGIKFSQYNGIYVLNVTVLDPDYSFCQLRTQFAVEVFGAFPPGSLPALRVMLITCGLGLVALISFYIIDVSYLREAEEEHEEKRRDSFPY